MAGTVGCFIITENLGLPWSVPLDRLFVIASTISTPSSSFTPISVVLPAGYDSSCNELSAHRLEDRGRAASSSKVDPRIPSDVSTEDRRSNYGVGGHGSCSVDSIVRFVDIHPLEESSSGNGKARSFRVWIPPLWHHRPSPPLYSVLHQGMLREMSDFEKLECDESVAQRAWNILNDSLQLPLCVQFTANTIACAALYLAAMWDVQRSVNR